MNQDLKQRMIRKILQLAVEHWYDPLNFTFRVEENQCLNSILILDVSILKYDRKVQRKIPFTYEQLMDLVSVEEVIIYKVQEGSRSMERALNDPQAESVHFPPDVDFTECPFNGEPGWKVKRGPRQAVAADKVTAYDMLLSVEKHANAKEA